MRHSTCALPRRTIVNFIVIGCVFPISRVQGQVGEAELTRARIEARTQDSVRLAKRDAWLATQGKLEIARQIHTSYTPEFLARTYRRYVTGNDDDREFIRREAAYRAQDIAAMYTVDEIAALKARGIKILTAVNGGGSLADVVATSDLIAIVEVTAVDTAAEGSDGRHSTVTVKPVETFKGSSSVTLIRIRELTGKAKSGIVTDAPGDMVVDSGTRLVPPRIGSRFLLFLSKNQYQLRILREDKVPINDGDSYYTRVGPVYRLTADNRLESQRPGEWKTSIEEIQELTSPYK